jgi:hypothetical protein
MPLLGACCDDMVGSGGVWLLPCKDRLHFGWHTVWRIIPCMVSMNDAHTRP